MPLEKCPTCGELVPLGIIQAHAKDHAKRIAALEACLRELVERCEDCHKIRGQRTLCDKCWKALALLGGEKGEKS